MLVVNKAELKHWTLSIIDNVASRLLEVQGVAIMQVITWQSIYYSST